MRDNLPVVLDKMPQPKIKIWYGLVQLRKSHNMTQTELAKMLDVDQSFISHLEKGKKKCPDHLLPKLASIFDTEVDILLEDAYTIDNAKQVIAEQVQLIANKPMEKVTDRDKAFLLQVIRTLQPQILVEEKITQKVGFDGEQAYERAIKKVRIHQEGKDNPNVPKELGSE